MEYVFGPVPSRRLGHSLGINIVPRKVCSFDCIYCEVGKTTELTLERQSFFDVDTFIKEVKEKYAEFEHMIDVVTITGAGEPTLNSDLKEIITRLKSFIKHPLVILTNSSLIDDPQIRSELQLLDIVVPSLDAVTESIFIEINKPHPTQDLQKLVEGFIIFANDFTGILYPEILIIKGINDTDSEIGKIAEILKQCNYTTVHLNTAFRPAAYEGTTALNDHELLDIALKFKKNGVKIEPAEKFIKNLSLKNTDNPVNEILHLLEMRPCTISEITDIFSIDNTHVVRILNKHFEANKIKKETHNGEEFYSSIDL